MRKYTILFNFNLTFREFATFTLCFVNMKKLYTACLLFISLFASVHAETGVASADTGILSFRFKNINFLRDDEYANPITEGYTLIGFIIQPTLVYSPVSRLTLSLGAQIQSYAGAAKINSPALIFSTSYKISKRWTITLGSLDGCDKHRMDDPHYYRERLYTAYTESGLRLFMEDANIFNDVWVNWENFIFKGDTTREIFHIGESFNYLSPEFWNGFSFEMPVQMIAKHMGGQISNYPEHVETFYNFSLGLRINYNIAGGTYGRIGIEYQQFRFQFVSLHGNIGIKYGNAFWLRLHYDLGSFYFGSYYWKGHDFYAPDGNPIYSSISDRTPDLIIPDRSIWTNSVYFTIHPIKNFELFTGVDLYYDMLAKHLDEALTLHLRFDQMITLHRFK
jgi:hypothetical protein